MNNSINSAKKLAMMINPDLVPAHIMEGAQKALTILELYKDVPLPDSFLSSPDYAKLCNSIIIGAPRKDILSKDNRSWLGTIRYRTGTVDIAVSVEQAIITCKNAFELVVLILSNVVRACKGLKGSAFIAAESLIRTLTNEALKASERSVTIGEDSLEYFEDTFIDINWCSSIKPLIVKMVG